MKRIILLLMLSLGASLWAQSVTLEECRHWAQENYPLVQKYNLVAKSMDYSVLNASRAWLPQVRLSAQATWQTDAASFPDEMTAMLAVTGLELEGIRQDQYKLALDVQQNIWDGGRSAAEKRIVQQQAEVDRLSIDMDFHALEGRVDDLFFGILLIEEQRLQIASRLALLEDNLRRCQVMKDNGLLMQSDVDAVEAELLTARQQSEQFDRSCEAYREMLSLLTGKPMSETLLTTPEARPSLSSLESNPQVRMIEAMSSQTEAQEDLVRSASMPQFSLFAQGWYGYPGLNMFKNMQNADWSLNAIVGIRLAWNISAYYTQKNNLDRLHNTRQQIAVQRDVLQFNRSLQLRQMENEVARLGSTLRDDDRIVDLRKSVREAAEVKHAEGVMGTTDLLHAITDESTAQSARTLHRIEMIKKQYEISRL